MSYRGMMHSYSENNPLTSMDAIIQLARDNGSHFFDRDAMRFFRSRLCSMTATSTPGYALFVTSEQFEFRGDRHPRKYTVRMINPQGQMTECGSFQQYDTLRRADSAMYRICEWLNGVQWLRAA